MYYFDNAATSFPKPSEVINAINECLTVYGVSPGRSGHSLSVRTAREVFETRELIASFFNLDNSERVIFTANATMAINTAVKGILKKGDHVIISHMEHNSVHRPLMHLKHSRGIDLSVASCDQSGVIDLHHLRTLFRPETRLVVVNHGSNAFGSIQPVREIGAICRDHKVLFLVDAAQTAGYIDIDVVKDNIDILVFSGHKKLMGPQGIGGLVINSGVQIDTLIHGGTGSRSESDTQPGFYPDRLEAGTLNTPGIVGLKAGIKWINENDFDGIRNHQLRLTRLLADHLKQTPGITIYGPEDMENRLPVISVAAKNVNPGEMARRLDKEYGIMTRAGLHCSPLAHKAMGTFPEGTLRLSPGIFNTEQEIALVAEAFTNLLIY